MPDTILKNKMISGIAWNSIEKFAIQGLGIVTGIILARILAPSDYGLVGMVSIFFAFSELIVGSGFSMALIQKNDRTDADYSTVFHFNFVVSIIVYIILFICAPLIADFFNNDLLIVLTRVLSLTIIINSLTIVQQTRLTIQLNFKTQAVISLFSVVISGLIGVYMAYHGFGVWSIVMQMLSGSSVRTICFFMFDRWLPLAIFRISSFKELFSFSSKLLGAALIASVVNNLYVLLIGKLFEARDLGFYTKARQYPEMLSGTIASVLQGVTFPILSSLQNEHENMVTVYERLMGMVVFCVIPALTLFAVLSEPLVRFFLTEKWMPIVPLMQWFCFARMITPISALNMNILNAIGRSDLFFLVDISKLPLTILALVITIPLGLTAVVIGHFITSFICFFVNAFYPGKLFGFGAYRQIKGMWRVICATCVMSFAVYICSKAVHSDFMKLFLGVPLGIGMYLIMAYFLKIKEVEEVFNIIDKIIQRRGSLTTT